MARRPLRSAVLAFSALLALAAPVLQASASPIVTGDGKTSIGRTSPQKVARDVPAPTSLMLLGASLIAIGALTRATLRRVR